MELTSFEYVSVKNWCTPVTAGELTARAGNSIYWHNIDVSPWKIDLENQLSRQPGFPDLHDCDGDFVKTFVPRFDEREQSIGPLSQPFVARLENVRVEFPGLGVFLDRHLLMAETYHDAAHTDMSGGWHGPRGSRHKIPVQIGVNAGDATVPVPIEIKFYTNREPDQYCDTPALMLSGPSAYNYCHWMNEMVPRLWCWSAVPELRELPVVVRYPLLPFQAETLAALGIGADRIVPFTGHTLQARTLYFPSYFLPGTYCPHNLEWLRSHLPAAFGVAPQEPRNLVYVSRSNAGSRRVLNEEEVLAGLEPLGFQTVRLEQMTVKQQIECFAGAAAVIMPAGAAGINMVFASPGAALIELHPTGYRHPMHFIHCSLIGCQYGCLICDTSAAPQSQDFTVDTGALMSVTRALLKQKNLQ